MLAKRLAGLEARSPATGQPPLELVGIPAAVAARIMRAEAEGSFPQSLCDADLEAILALADEQRGRHGR